MPLKFFFHHYCYNDSHVKKKEEKEKEIKSFNIKSSKTVRLPKTFLDIERDCPTQKKKDERLGENLNGRDLLTWVPLEMADVISCVTREIAQKCMKT